MESADVVSSDFDEQTNPLVQPKGFWEVWSYTLTGNLAFYIFYSIFAVFFVEFLGMDQAQASVVFGSFMALNWGLTPIGGYVSDHILGALKSIVLGNILTTIGFICEATALFTNTHWLVFAGFTCILVGSGTSRVNGIKLLTYMYHNHKSKADAGYTIFYSAVNVGSMIALIIAPMLHNNNGTPHAYGVIFLFSAAAMILTLLVVTVAVPRWRKVVQGNEDNLKMTPLKTLGCIIGYPVGLAVLYFLLTHLTVSNIVFYIISAAALIMFFFEMTKETKESRNLMWVALILTVEAVFFYVLYAQMGTSMNFYAINNARDVYIGSYHVDNLIYQALNPFWIIILSPILAIMYNKQAKSGKGLPMPYKFAYGMLLSFLAFLSFGVASNFADVQGYISPLWFFLANFFQSAAELLIGALGLSMVMKYTPKRINGLVIGVWYLSMSMANIIGGIVASHTGIKSGKMPAPQSLAQYGHFFYMLSVAIIIFAAVMFVVAPLLMKLIRGKDGAVKSGDI